MSIALITEANPRSMRESHPSFLMEGKWFVRASDGVKSKLSVRRSSADQSSESVLAIGDHFDGMCTVIVQVIEPHSEDSRISVFAERVKNV